MYVQLKVMVFLLIDSMMALIDIFFFFFFNLLKKKLLDQDIQLLWKVCEWRKRGIVM